LPCWKDSLEESSEAFEYLITKEKFSLLFGTESLDKQKDEQLALAYQKFQFIRPDHLEIQTQGIPEHLLQVAVSGNS